MKVRILGNTMRLRVKQHEVSALHDNGLIEEVLAFGTFDEDKLRFQVVTSDAFAIDQKKLVISIFVPHVHVHTWATTDLVGIEQTITTTKGLDIYVLIEKDFACLDNDREDEEGSYPNPMLGCKIGEE